MKANGQAVKLFKDEMNSKFAAQQEEVNNQIKLIVKTIYLFKSKWYAFQNLYNMSSVSQEGEQIKLYVK